MVLCLLPVARDGATFAAEGGSAATLVLGLTKNVSCIIHEQGSKIPKRHDGFFSFLRHYGEYPLSRVRIVRRCC